MSDNVKLNLKQYRQLIYARIKKFYKDDSIATKSWLSSPGRNHSNYNYNTRSQIRKISKEKYHDNDVSMMSVANAGNENSFATTGTEQSSIGSSFYDK